MSKKVWSISTTVREPDRTRNFLKTLKEIEWEEWNIENQAKFQKLLIKNRFYWFWENQFLNWLTKELRDKIEDINYALTFDDIDKVLEIKNYEWWAEMRWRNSRKPLEKLWLTHLDENRKIIISSLWEYLLEDDYDLSELMFKSFLKWQYPNPVDREMSDSSIYNIKPFIWVMHLIKKVNELALEKWLIVKWISKEEFMIFWLSLINYRDINDYAEKLLDFRIKKDELQTREEKKDFVDNYKNSFLEDFSNTDNIKDYSDNAIRYFRLTKYFYIRWGWYYIDLEPRREIEINKLLEKFDWSIENLNRVDYINYISDINSPILPWEEKEELIKIINKIIDEIEYLKKSLNIVDKIEWIENLDSKDINYIKAKISYLRSYRKKLQDIELKNQLKDTSKIDETIDSLNNIRNLNLKPSIALEKWTTIALNIINDAKEIKSNAPFWDDNEILFTAPSWKPDIECYYESFNSVCEVTMLNSRSQWINEWQPVMRHLRDFEDKSNKEYNYAIFIAPALHRDTINTFWTSVKYEYEEKKQKIVPLTITQLIDILKIVKYIKQNNFNFTHLKFKELLDNIVDIQWVSNSWDWANKIPQKINNWKELLLSNS